MRLVFWIKANVSRVVSREKALTKQMTGFKELRQVNVKGKHMYTTKSDDAKGPFAKGSVNGKEARRRRPTT